MRSRFFAILVFALAASARAQDVPVTAASYIGGSGNDAVAGVALLPDETVAVGGTVPTPLPGVPTVDVAGGGTGVVLRLSPDGRRMLGAVRVGTAVTDIEAGPAGRLAVAARGVGPVVLDGTAVVWQAPLADVARVAIAADGTVAALTTGRVVVTYDAAGTELGRRTFGDSFLEDVAVDAATGLVFVTGYNNKNTGREPIQVAFVRAFSHDLATLVWRAYDWPGSVGRNEQNPNVADSRGYRVAMGADGQLYFAGESHGGNTTFFYSPQTVGELLGTDRRVRYDAYTDAYNTSSSPVAVVGRFRPATGALDRIQLVLTRLTNSRGNTLRPRGIAADAEGRVYVTGQATAFIDGRTAPRTVGGQPLAEYSGYEAFLLVVAPDFRSREAWTAFTASGPHQSGGTGVAVRGRAFALGASTDNATAAFVTVDAFAPTRGAGTEGYVVVRGSRPVAAETNPGSEALRLDVFGSPSRLSVRVVFEAPTGPARLDVVDAQGRTVRTLDARAAQGEVRLDVSSLAPGPYWVRLVDGERRAVAPVVVVR